MLAAPLGVGHFQHLPPPLESVQVLRSEVFSIHSRNDQFAHEGAGWAAWRSGHFQRHSVNFVACHYILAHSIPLRALIALEGLRQHLPQLGRQPVPPLLRPSSPAHYDGHPQLPAPPHAIPFPRHHK